jgi:hypothetical protein
MGRFSKMVGIEKLAQWDREDAARQADHAHRERIHAEINADFHREAAIAHDERTIPEVWKITQAIAAGRIRHLTINY